MRSVNQLVHSRALARQRFALFPLEGYPTSRVPGWEVAELRVLASPAIGAKFVQYLFTWAPGNVARFSADAHLETFIYVLDGSVTIEMANRPDAQLNVGGYALLPPGAAFELRTAGAGRSLLLRKRYEPAAGVPIFAPLFNHAADVPAPAWMDNPHARLQTLVPDELQYDLSMNIFTFDAGFGLPYVETHVMEHGLYFIQGKGLYYLNDTWMEVEQNDYIWMGPYCPQSFYATGPVASKYIYYKNVNREIAI